MQRNGWLPHENDGYSGNISSTSFQTSNGNGGGRKYLVCWLRSTENDGLGNIFVSTTSLSIATKIVFFFWKRWRRDFSVLHTWYVYIYRRIAGRFVVLCALPVCRENPLGNSRCTPTLATLSYEKQEPTQEFQPEISGEIGNSEADMLKLVWSTPFSGPISRFPLAASILVSYP